MADFIFGGTEEENAELKKLHAEVVSGLPLTCALYVANIHTDILFVAVVGRF